jgi:PAS domain S-box-containing protein
MNSEKSQPDMVLEARMLGALLNSAAEAIITISEFGLIEQVNPATEKLFGYTMDDLVGKNVKILMPEPYRGKHDAFLANYRKTSRKKIIGTGRDVMAQRQDGTTFPIHLSVGEFEIDGKKHFTGIIHDRSERQRAEIATTRLGQMIEDSRNEVFVFDAQTLHFKNANRAARNNIGYSLEELTNLTPVDIKPEMSPAKFKALTDPLKRGEKDVVSFRTTHRRKDGSEYTVDIDLRLSSAVNPPEFVAIMSDVTEEIKRERALVRTQKMEAIGQLTGGIAHDFNNLLTVIIGNLELLEPKLGDPKQRELLADAFEAAEMGAQLTHRLLSFARRSHLEPETLNLNNTILNIIDLLRRTIGEQINLSTILKPELWLAEADPGQIESVLLNLAINARDAMANGGTLIVETRNTVIDPDMTDIWKVDAGEYVQLSVTDTGEGIEPEIIDRVFEPFFTTKQAGQGTGMGLSMVYGFATQSGGFVTIYSEPGLGTTINLYLPRSEIEEVNISGEVELIAKKAERVRDKTILMVEDDEKLRNLTQKRLEDIGYQVIAASNAKEALAVFKKTAEIDLLLTDIVMPGGMSGHDLAHEIRTLDQDFKVLLTSGYAEELFDSKDTDRGHLRLLRKPYRKADLAKALEEVFAS